MVTRLLEPLAMPPEFWPMRLSIVGSSCTAAGGSFRKATVKRLAPIATKLCDRRKRYGGGGWFDGCCTSRGACSSSAEALTLR